MCYGATPKTLETLYPPRIIKYDEIQGIIQADDKIKELQEKRLSKTMTENGLIRKIFIKPNKIIEFSNGHTQTF